MLKKAGIIGLGSYLPSKILTNFDFEKIVDTSDEWIKTRTGIKERRIAAQNETTLDLAYQASKKALAAANLEAQALDLIIVATVTPDYIFPATACLLQDRLGASKAGAFDLEAGCSGFTYALISAFQYLQANTMENILVVGAEVLSRITDYEDRNTCVLFGDGAGAAVLGQSEQGQLISFHLGSQGSGGHFLQLPAGGSKQPASTQTVNNRHHFIKMDGNQVYKFAVKAMASSAQKAIDIAGLTTKDIDLFIPHQANNRIIEASAKRLGIPMEKVFVNLPYYGNTSGASIPIALDEAIQQKRLQRGQYAVLVGFGAGLSYASALIKW